MFKRILVPIDGSPTSDKALAAALQLARESSGRVRLVHSFDELNYLSGFEQGAEVIEQAHGYAEKILQDGLRTARSAGVQADARMVDSLGQRLGEQMAEQAVRFEADLVVVGTHGRRGVGRALLGSGAEQIIRCAPVAVLTIRGDAA